MSRIYTYPPIIGKPYSWELDEAIADIRVKESPKESQYLVHESANQAVDQIYGITMKRFKLFKCLPCSGGPLDGRKVMAHLDRPYALRKGRHERHNYAVQDGQLEYAGSEITVDTDSKDKQIEKLAGLKRAREDDIQS